MEFTRVFLNRHHSASHPAWRGSMGYG
jgi:hypothetical protein